MQHLILVSRFISMKIMCLILFCFFVRQNLYSQCDNISLNIEGFNPNCFGEYTGAINISLTGFNGNPTYTVTHLNYILINQHLLGLGSGWYIVEAMDDSSCYIIDSIYLEDPAPIEAVVTIMPPSSLFACDGIAVVDTVLNAQGDILFDWKPDGPNGFNENKKTNLCHGFYYLRIVDAYVCTYIEKLIVGTASNSSQSHLSETIIYPNPATEILIVKIADEYTNTSIEIINSYGQIIIKRKNVSSNNTEFDLSSFSRGVYFVNLIKENMSQSKMFIKL